MTVSDGALTASDTFVLTVNAVNDAPTISDIANQTTTANTATGPLSFTVGDVETAAGSLTVSGSSNNTTLVPNGNIVFGGSGANRTVTVTPAANQSGTATITVTVSDGALTASDTFVLTVNCAPDRGPGGGVWLQRRLGDERDRCLGQREYGDDYGCDVDCERQVWKGAVFQWDQQSRADRRFDLAAPDDGDDAGGMGIPGGFTERLANDCPEGSGHLSVARQFECGAATGDGGDLRQHGDLDSLAERHSGECLDAPCFDL